MSVFSLAELEAYWILAGGKPSAAPTAAAVAMAESHGNPNATNQNNNGTTDRGLWQINSIHGSLSTFDPLANAKAAVQISNNGTDWHPWTTFQHNKQQPYMAQATALLPHVEADIKGLTPPSNNGGLGIPGLDQAAGAITGALDTVSSAGRGLEAIVNFLTNPTYWLRIGEVIAGAVLIAMGLRAMTGASVPRLATAPYRSAKAAIT